MKKTSLELKGIVKDESLPKEERIAAALEIKNRLLNPLPVEEFDPETFDPNSEDPISQLIPRKRKRPPKRLPTKGLKPKELMEGQMVGMFESKQELFLFMAHYINDLLDRVEALESQLPKDKV